MRLKYIIFSLLSIQLTVLSSQALELGDVAIGGTGCFGSTELIIGDNGRLVLPVRVRVNKKSDSAFDRKSCNIRIPVTLNANEKLQILDVKQAVRVVAYKGSEVKSTVNVSLVGQKTNDLILAVSAVENNISLVDAVRSEPSRVLAESKCGASTMLTGNMNVLVTGAAKAFVSTAATQVTLQVVSCEL